MSGDSRRGKQLLQKEAARGEAGLRKQETVDQEVQTNLNRCLGNTGGKTCMARVHTRTHTQTRVNCLQSFRSLFLTST